MLRPTGCPPEIEYGKLIIYTWTEDAIYSYTSGVEVMDGSTIFTNRHEPGTTSVSVVKIWIDNDDAAGLRPEKVIVVLNNCMRVVLSAANGWSATMDDLSAFRFHLNADRGNPADINRSAVGIYEKMLVISSRSDCSAFLCNREMGMIE